MVRAASLCRSQLRKRVSIDQLRALAAEQIATNVQLPPPKAIAHAHERPLSVSERLTMRLDRLDRSLQKRTQESVSKWTGAPAAAPSSEPPFHAAPVAAFRLIGASRSRLPDGTAEARARMQTIGSGASSRGAVGATLLATAAWSRSAGPASAQVRSGSADTHQALLPWPQGPAQDGGHLRKIHSTPGLRRSRS
jgi:hypothetical protein